MKQLQLIKQSKDCPELFKELVVDLLAKQALKWIDVQLNMDPKTYIAILKALLQTRSLEGFNIYRQPYSQPIVFDFVIAPTCRVERLDLQGSN